MSVSVSWWVREGQLVRFLNVVRGVVKHENG